MEITKGYTISQFIDLVVKHKEWFHKGRSEGFTLIEKYNELYKQPLSKGLFIPCDNEGNELEIPMIGVHNPKEYKGAKNKVIFKGWRIQNMSRDKIGFIVIMKNGNYGLSKYDNQDYFLMCTRVIKTVGDLFESTNGELETNINI